MSGTLSLGVDVGGTGIKWAVTSGAEVIRSGAVPTPRTTSAAVLEAVGALVEDQRGSIDAVGVTFPGLIDTVARSTVFVPNLPGDWSGVRVAELLEQRGDARVSLINDARAFAYAEFRAGAAAGRTDALFMVLGTGVGGAVALQGRLLIGEMDAIGEVGHTIVEPGGAICGCGGRGCLETVASASGIVAYATRARLASLSPGLSSLAGEITAADVASAARSGDALCLDAFARAGRAIGLASGNVASLLRVNTVVVGGGLTPAFDLLKGAAELALAERRPLIGDIDLVPARLGGSAGAIGAALFAADELSAHSTPRSERTSP